MRIEQEPQRGGLSAAHAATAQLQPQGFGILPSNLQVRRIAIRRQSDGHRPVGMRIEHRHQRQHVVPSVARATGNGCVGRRREGWIGRHVHHAPLAGREDLPLSAEQRQLDGHVMPRSRSLPRERQIPRHPALSVGRKCSLTESPSVSSACCRRRGIGRCRPTFRLKGSHRTGDLVTNHHLYRPLQPLLQLPSDRCGRRGVVRTMGRRDDDEQRRARYG